MSQESDQTNGASTHGAYGDAAPIARAAAGPSAGATLSVEAMRCFLGVVDRGGVAGAAEQVNRSPSAVSMQLKKLEETLGAPLFEREPRGMRPTAQGERLIGHARRLLAAHAAALEAFRRPDLVGEVRLGLNGDVGPLRLSEMLASFAETHPMVQVSARVASSERVCAMLEEGAIDLAIFSPGEGFALRDDDMILSDQPLLWVGAIGGKAHLRRPTPVALASSGCAWRAKAVNWLSEAGMDWRPAYVSDSSPANFAAAAADLAIAIAPKSALSFEPRLEVIAFGGRDAPALGRTQLALRLPRRAAPFEPAEALADRIAAVYERVRLRGGSDLGPRSAA
ncbi:MAG: LysR family transcriptional regulator [Pseudomonadota bacterium]